MITNNILKFEFRFVATSWFQYFLYLFDVLYVFYSVIDNQIKFCDHRVNRNPRELYALLWNSFVCYTCIKSYASNKILNT